MESHPQWTPSCPICETFVAGIYRLYEKKNHKKPDVKTVPDPKVRHTVAKTLARAKKWIARELARSPEVDEDDMSWTFEFRDSGGLHRLLETEGCLWCYILKSAWGHLVRETRTIHVKFQCTRNQKVEGILGDIVSLQATGYVEGVATIHIRDERSHQSNTQTSLTVQQGRSALTTTHREVDTRNGTLRQGSHRMSYNDPR